MWRGTQKKGNKGVNSNEFWAGVFLKNEFWTSLKTNQTESMSINEDSSYAEPGLTTYTSKVSFLQDLWVFLRAYRFRADCWNYIHMVTIIYGKNLWKRSMLDMIDKFSCFFLTILMYWLCEKRARSSSIERGRENELSEI